MFSFPYEIYMSNSFLVKQNSHSTTERSRYIGHIIQRAELIICNYKHISKAPAIIRGESTLLLRNFMVRWWWYVALIPVGIGRDR